PGRLLSRMRFVTEGDVPVPFELAYDTALIQSRGRYTLRARLILGDEVLYRSTHVLPVLGRGLDPRPQVLMEKVRPVISGGSPVGERWRVTRIEGIEALGFTKAVLIFDEEGEIRGNAGCNTVSGPFKIDGNKIEIPYPATSKRGCSSPIIARERAYLRAVTQAVSYERDGDRLSLFDASGLETMRLSRE
ncbi:MAG: META domain-containing protein, partial [Pseudomonadota bacterium]